jgi:hypothetical protein
MRKSDSERNETGSKERRFRCERKSVNNCGFGPIFLKIPVVDEAKGF